MNARRAFAVAAVSAGCAPGLAMLVAGTLQGADRSLFGGALMLTLAAVSIALAHLVIAVPLYLLLRRHGGLSWVIAGVSGFLIGAMPVTAFILALGGRLSAMTSLSSVAMLGGAGLVGGLVFRAMLGPQQ